MTESRQIIHVDMDAFYASVEQLDNPDLVGKAVVVGGATDKRGVVSTPSYEARKFGVHSDLPMSQAIKRCPQAVVLPVRMKRYAELSRQIHAIFRTYTPQIEPVRCKTHLGINSHSRYEIHSRPASTFIREGSVPFVHKELCEE